MLTPTWQATLRIRYIDGTIVEGTTADWRACRADSLDEVWVGNPRETAFAGHSLYWLYWEWRHGAPEGYWVAGCGTVANVSQEIPREVLFHRSGEQWARPVTFMPDLQHMDVKLGWWRR